MTAILTTQIEIRFVQHHWTVYCKEQADEKFTIRWFRENTTGAVEDLGLGDSYSSAKYMIIDIKISSSKFS